MKVVSELMDQIEDLKAAKTSGSSAAITAGCEIHGMPVSANAVGAILFAKHVLGDSCEFKVCNLMEGEQMKPEYLAMNPYHTIPTYKDSSGFSLGESNAILRYIANKYAPQYYGAGDNDSRAIIDWALDLRSMKIYSDHKQGDFSHIVYPVMGFAPPPADQDKTNADCVASLNTFADKFLQQTFVGGLSLCIADFALAPIVFALGHSTIKAKTGFELPPRWVKYIDAFMAATPTSALLTSAGGYSISEFLDSKA